MSNQLIPQFQQFFNNNGVAESGLELYTYEAGGLINKVTYQTYGGTANTNPVLMDSAGYPPAGIYGSGSYRLILKDAEGVTLKDLDNVVLTEGLQPDANGDYVIPGNLDVQTALTIGDAVIEANGDYVVTLDGNEVMRTTPEGHIALNGANIPSDVDPTYKHTFYTDHSVRIESPTTNGAYYITSGIYRKLTGWALTGASNGRLRAYRLNDEEVSESTNATPAIGQTATFQKIFQLDSNGDVRIQTGKSYLSNL